MPVLNNVRYASDSDHLRYESELTLWANSGHSVSKISAAIATRADESDSGSVENERSLCFRPRYQSFEISSARHFELV